MKAIPRTPSAARWRLALVLIPFLWVPGRVAAGEVPLLQEQGSAGEIVVESVILKLVSDVQVPAREAGVIDSIDVEAGGWVEKGDVLARINDEQKRLVRDRAQLELEIARAEAESDIGVREASEELRVAELDLQRGQDSRDRFSRALSDSEIDQLKLEVELAKLKLESAKLAVGNAVTRQQLSENQLKMAESALARHEIRSPLAGVVEEITREQGEWVEPGDPVLRVIAIQQLRAEGFLAASMASSTLEGRPVELVITMPNGEVERFPGVIRQVSREVDPVNQEVRILAEISNRDLLLSPGRRGRLLIQPAVPSRRDRP